MRGKARSHKKIKYNMSFIYSKSCYSSKVSAVNGGEGAITPLSTPGYTTVGICTYVHYGSTTHLVVTRPCFDYCLFLEYLFYFLPIRWRELTITTIEYENNIFIIVIILKINLRIYFMKNKRYIIGRHR